LCAILQSSPPNKDHKYPEGDSQSSKVFILNFDDLNGSYCLKDKHPFQNVTDSSMATFCSGDTDFEILSLGGTEWESS
jgi:hypothetical protein